jgi:hypothetical protein
MQSFKNVLTVFVCLLVFSTLFWYQQGSANPQTDVDQKEKSVINVTGSADVMVIPDEAIITLGIDTRNKDIVNAKNENDKKVKDVLNAAKKFNIDPKYIKVDYINIRPGDITVKQIYEPYGSIPLENSGYIARKRITITVKDLSKFEDFLTELVKNGAEYITGVDFKTSSLRANKDKARELAVKAAKEKADAMTAVLGQKAGKAITINEEQEYYWSWYDSWYSGYYGGNSVSMANNVQNVVSSGQQPDGEGAMPGQIKVSAKVNIQFSLE